MAHILTTDGLTRKFRTLTAVDHVSITIEHGEIFGLLGRNGAGKSTLIKMLTTLLPPTSGTAHVGGFDISREPKRVRRHIGYVPQALSADGELTGYDNLLVFAKIYDLPARERESRIRDSLSFMGLEEASDNLVKTYSGGMIRRLEIAQSMLHRPEILFMDEPTIGLDPVAREAVWMHVKELCATYKTTIFLTTHYMEEAEQLCSRIAVMRRGQIVGLGTKEQLKTAHGAADASLDDVFADLTEGPTETEGGYRDALKTRKTARRLQ